MGKFRGDRTVPDPAVHAVCTTPCCSPLLLVTAGPRADVYVTFVTLGLGGFLERWVPVQLAYRYPGLACAGS